MLRPGGELLVSIPNLAHLQSRIQFLLRGRLIRTASEFKHPGDRPAGEYITLGQRAGFTLTARHGIFPTIPVVTHFVRRHPRALAPLHRALTRCRSRAGVSACFRGVDCDSLQIGDCVPTASSPIGNAIANP